MSGNTSAVLAAALAMLVTGTVAHAQTPAPPAAQAPAQTSDRARLDILTFGGFLGQLDGFCEHPAATYSLVRGTLPVVAPICQPGGPGGSRPVTASASAPVALGGVLGAIAWRRTQGDGQPLVLIAGDNQLPDFSYSTPPTDQQRQKRPEDIALRVTREKRSTDRSGSFWQDVQQLRPTAVALGPEDFLRSLRTPPADLTAVDPMGLRASRFFDWIRGGAGIGLPFVASNAVVKVDEHNLEARGAGYEIVGVGSASLGWSRTLKIRHPANATARYSLEESPGDSTESGSLRSVPLDPPTEDDADHTTLTIAEGSLMPGRLYRLLIAVEGQTIALPFRTHKALTTTLPKAGKLSRVAMALSGFPVIVTPACTPSEQTRPEQPCAEDIVIVGLVDPATSGGLGKDAWAFTRGEKGPKLSYSLGFIGADEALGAIFRRLAALGERTPAPLVVLMSSLNDADTGALLESYPEIRVVVLRPDSELLGRGSRATVNEGKDIVARRFGTRVTPASTPALAYSGDLGLAAVVNGEHPQATRVVVRPEWIGETAATIASEISRNLSGEWELARPAVTVSTIPGVTLEVKFDESAPSYLPTGFPDRTVGPYTPYFRNSRNADVDADRLVKIFTTVPGFAAAAGEAVRAELRGDIAIVPEDTFDQDAVAWMKGAIVGRDVAWLSRFFLERLVFRSYRFVRADVKGSDLPTVLGKALADPLGTGYKACVVGLGISACPAALDKDHPERLRLRDRAIVSTMFYNVVLPDSMAEALALQHDEAGRSTDILESLDSYLHGDGWKVASGDRAIDSDPASIFQFRNAHEVRRYVNLSTAALGYKRTFADDVINHAALTGSLPVDFRGAKPEQTISAKVDADMAVWETRTHAGRVLGSLDVSQRTEYKARRADGSTPDPDVTTPNDSFSIGGRIERRKITSRWSIEARPYGGVFFEGAFHEKKTDLTASRKADAARADFGLTESAGFTTPITFQPSTFTYGSGGIDFLPAATDIFPQKQWSASFTRMGADVAYGRITHVLTSVDLGGLPQDMARFVGEGASRLLNDYFTEHHATFDSSVGWAVHDEPRWQFRMRVQAEGEIMFKGANRAFKATIAARQDYINMKGDVPATSLARNTKFSTTLAVPIWWRLELAPMYEFQMATLHDGDPRRLSVQKFELKANVPLFIRFGRGRFVQ